MERIELVSADCEANGLLDTVTRVHCVVAKDHATGDIYKFWGDTLRVGFPLFARRVKKWVFHNGLGYDLELLDRMLGVTISHKDCYDTLILSRMDNVDIRVDKAWECTKAKKAPHGLGAWGYRVGLGKPDIDEWDIDMNDPVEREKMLHRCTMDVEITERVFDRLMKSLKEKECTNFAMGVEHDIRWSLNKMEKHGFYLDVPKALKLQHEVDTRAKEIETEIHLHFPPLPKPEKEKGEVKMFIRKDKVSKTGELSVVGLKGRIPEADAVVLAKEDLKNYRVGFKDMPIEQKRIIAEGSIPFKERIKEAQAKLEATVVGDISWFEWQPFSLNSPTQVVSRLNECGWKPTVRTDGFRDFKRAYENGEMSEEEWEYKKLMSWKSTDPDNLDTIPDDAPESAKLIGEYAWITDRSSKITEFMNFVGEDSYIRGRITTIGAWSQRCSHSAPNMANVASVKCGEYIKVSKHVYQAYDKKNKRRVGLELSTRDMTSLGYSRHLRNRIEAVKDDKPFDLPTLGHAGRYGYEMRGLLTTGDQALRVICGSDASGIQLRALVHYMEDDDYKNAILTGDIHRFNASKLFSLKSPDDVTDAQRKTAKTFIYAFLLGAGDEKIGDIAGVPDGGTLHISPSGITEGRWVIINSRDNSQETVTVQEIEKRGLSKYITRTSWKTGKHLGYKKQAQVSEKIAEGARLRKQFLDGLPKLARLIEKAHERADIGYMKGLDGRPVPVPSKHKSLTAYLQSFEAIIMKTAIILWEKRKTEMGIDAHSVAFVHDELQMDCAEDVAETAGKLFVQCIEDAGKLYGSYIPLTGDYLIGMHWADAH